MFAASDVERLRRSFRALVRRFSVSERADVQCCGMTVAQGATLEALRREGALTPRELGKRLGVSPSTLSRNLARLEASGLIERRADREDGRSYHVALTRSGRGAARRLEAIEDRFAERVLRRLTPERRSQALEGLTDLLDAVRLETEACCPGAYDHLLDRNLKENAS